MASRTTGTRVRIKSPREFKRRTGTIVEVVSGGYKIKLDHSVDGESDGIWGGEYIETIMSADAETVALSMLAKKRIDFSNTL